MKLNEIDRSKERGITYKCEGIEIWWWHLWVAYDKEDMSCMLQDFLSLLSQPSSSSSSQPMGSQILEQDIAVTTYIDR